MMTADFFPTWPPAANSFALFGLLLLAGLLGGRVAATTRVLPAITGYILTGFILGPGVLGWLTEDALEDARIFADISLGLIVFELGRRLDIEWARHDRWLLPTGLAESLLSFAAMFALLRYFDVPALEAAVASTIGIATAPAVVLLVAAELKAEGPATRRALWHVALNNIVAMLGVALLLPFVEARVAGAPWHPIARALWLLAGSFLLGYVAFRVARLLARFVGKSDASQFILMVGMIVLTVGVAQVGKLSVLLALLVMGVCARNLDPDRRLIDIRFGHAARLFFVVLFVLTGATLRPDQFGTVAWLGLAFALVRLVGKGVALFAFAHPARVSVNQAATLTLALTPMAGLAIGMTQPIFDIAPEFGAHLAGIVASGIAILSVVGPIATRYALIKSGEGEPGERD
jgi:Kef-type K+ transport system membrane component KefB